MPNVEFFVIAAGPHLRLDSLHSSSAANYLTVRSRGRIVPGAMTSQSFGERFWDGVNDGPAPKKAFYVCIGCGVCA